MNTHAAVISLCLALGFASAGLIPTAGVLTSAPFNLVPEGQYVPDNLDKLYDDGSYRPELQPIPLAASPYGLTPAGSGLEGAYVHDLSEKLLYDDGSYRPELRAVPLAQSPYGLTPAGSGLEGAYVHDFSGNLHDDGSYTPGVH